MKVRVRVQRLSARDSRFCSPHLRAPALAKDSLQSGPPVPFGQASALRSPQPHHLRPAIRPLKLRAAIASSSLIAAVSSAPAPPRAITTIDVPAGICARNLFPETFAHAALDPVAHDRDADPSRHRHPQPRALRLILKTPRIDHEMRSRKSHAVSLEAQKFRAPMQPVGRGEAQLRAHCGSARLLGGYRDCKACSALRAPALEDLAAARRGHPRQESMGSFASAIMRLVGPFHCSGSRPASLGLNSDRRGPL